MRKFAAALVVVLVGCGGMVPLDSDGGGTPPSSCEAVFTDTDPSSPTVGTRIAGQRSVATNGAFVYCARDVADGTHFACAFPAGLRMPDIQFGLRFRAAPVAGATLRGGTEFVIDRVSVGGTSADTSAWGGAFVLTWVEQNTGGFGYSARGTACSAAGSALTITTDLELCSGSSC